MSRIQNYIFFANNIVIMILKENITLNVTE